MAKIDLVITKRADEDLYGYKIYYNEKVRYHSTSFKELDEVHADVKRDLDTMVDKLFRYYKKAEDKK